MEDVTSPLLNSNQMNIEQNIPDLSGSERQMDQQRHKDSLSPQQMNLQIKTEYREHDVFTSHEPNAAESKCFPFLYKMEPDSDLPSPSFDLCHTELLPCLTVDKVELESIKLSRIKLEPLADQQASLVVTQMSFDPAEDLAEVKPLIKQEEEERDVGWKQHSGESFDEYLREALWPKATEKEENSTETWAEVLVLSEFEELRGRVCHALRYKHKLEKTTDRQNENQKGDEMKTYSKGFNKKHAKVPSKKHNDVPSKNNDDLTSKKHNDMLGKRNVCKHCGRAYVHKKHLNAHMITHTGEKSYECKCCGKAFWRADVLVVHMRIHTGERPLREKRYPCDQCELKFTSPHYLKAHLRRHTGERPYPCDQCKKSFFELGELKKHQRIHTGERPYTCTECGHSFHSSHSLIKHRRIHTGERPYTCSQCGKAFPYKQSLKTHMLIHSK